jgi:hypothetical protein
LGVVSALGYASVLSWHTDANGVVTTSIKIGDVEVKLQQAREGGADESVHRGD